MDAIRWSVDILICGLASPRCWWSGRRCVILAAAFLLPPASRLSEKCARSGSGDQVDELSDAELDDDRKEVVSLSLLALHDGEGGDDALDEDERQRLPRPLPVSWSWSLSCSLPLLLVLPVLVVGVVNEGVNASREAMSSIDEGNGRQASREVCLTLTDGAASLVARLLLLLPLLVCVIRSRTSCGGMSSPMNEWTKKGSIARYQTIVRTKLLIDTLSHTNSSHSKWSTHLSMPLMCIRRSQHATSPTTPTT
mmetsp:Transcript_851/g.1904  ORF Transcript_851/g.1904 Transcript_851/m.1904 type:complete len:252 (-) Transcript_851:348-1103(-)